MRQVETEKVLCALKQHRNEGSHVDSRLLREVQAPGELYLFAIREATDFLRLVWQSIDHARPLVPVHQPRTLRDCAFRLAAFDWRFDKLVQAGYSWFSRCADIDSAFDYSRFGWIALTACKPSEQQEAPLGTYYVYDGVHKSIVLAKKILRNEVIYKPLEVLFLTPRRK